MFYGQRGWAGWRKCSTDLNTKQHFTAAQYSPVKLWVEGYIWWPASMLFCHLDTRSPLKFFNQPKNFYSFYLMWQQHFPHSNAKLQQLFNFWPSCQPVAPAVIINLGEVTYKRPNICSISSTGVFRRQATVKTRCGCFYRPKEGKTTNELNCFHSHLRGGDESQGHAKHDDEQHSMYQARPLIWFE